MILLISSHALQPYRHTSPASSSPMDSNIIREELKSAGVYPEGPCSAWPFERNEALLARVTEGHPRPKGTQIFKRSEPEIKATVGEMTKGLVRNAVAAIRGGRVSAEIRNERYDTCKVCPAFRASDKRCSDCGCFMEAKTWVNADPAMLCPQKKWSR